MERNRLPSRLQTQCCTDWKGKVVELVNVLNTPDKMTGSITINIHEGKPVDCVIEPKIRYR